MDEFLEEDDEWDDPEGLFDDPFEADDDFGEKEEYIQPRAPRAPRLTKPKKMFNEKIPTKKIVAPSGAGIIPLIAKAIQAHEGWVPPGGNLPRGSASFRNNNPGNLKYVGQAGAGGADERGFAIFRDYNSGWNALLRDIGAKLKRTPTHSSLSLIVEYEGGDPLNPPGNDLAYAKAVAKSLSNDTGKSVTIHTQLNAV